MEAAKLTGKPAVAPYSGEVWDLVTNELAHKAVVVPVIKKQAKGGVEVHGGEGTEHKITPATAKAESVYEELRKTGDSIMDLIEESQGNSNKDIQALTKELNELLKKYKG